MDESSHERKKHWEGVYSTKATDAVSWYQRVPEKSLELIAKSRILKSANIIDVGGGASTLVDQLLSRGFLQVTVLDISKAALNSAKERNAQLLKSSTWLEADILTVDLPQEQFDLWHDRAVFHFLTVRKDREEYIAQMDRAVKSGGHVIIATFSLDGPPKCSGLEVAHYAPATLQDEIGHKFELMESLYEDHRTPFDTIQKFVYCLFRKK